MLYFECKQSIFIFIYSIERPKKLSLALKIHIITQLCRCQFRTRSHDMPLKPKGEIRLPGCRDHLGFMFVTWLSIDRQSTLKNLKIRKHFRLSARHTGYEKAPALVFGRPYLKRAITTRLFSKY